MPQNPDTYLETTIPPKFHGIYKAAISGSRTSAVKAMCLECQGWEDGAVKAVRECPSVACPLHAVRPYQSRPEELDTSPEEADRRDLLRQIKSAALMKARAIRQQNRAEQKREE